MDDDALKKLEEFIKDGLNKSIALGLERACNIVEADAKRNCPVSDGQLRASITHDVDVSNNVGYVGSNVVYAPYVEIGTGIYSSKGTGRQSPWRYKDINGNWHVTQGMKPKPFLQPAIDKNHELIQKAFEGLV